MSPVFLYWNKHILINIPEDMHHSNCLGRWIFLKKDLSKISSGFVLFHELYPSLICITHHGTDIHRFSLLCCIWNGMWVATFSQWPLDPLYTMHIVLGKKRVWASFWAPGNLLRILCPEESYPSMTCVLFSKRVLHTRNT